MAAPPTSPAPALSGRRASRTALAGLALALAVSCAARALSSREADAPAIDSPAAADAAHDPALVALGRRLFFDERLSTPPGVACGTCHDPFLAWGDARPQGKGVQDHTLAGDVDGDGAPEHDARLAVLGNRFKTIPLRRNTPSLYNVSLYPRLFWDARTGGLVEQALLPFESPDEMGSPDASLASEASAPLAGGASWERRVEPFLRADAEYAALLTGAFGDRVPTRARVSAALAAFERTLLVLDTPFDRWLAGDERALSAEQERGRALFFGAAGCHRCHPAPLLTDFSARNLGVPQAGLFALEGAVDLGHGARFDASLDPPRGRDEPESYAAFRVPQLRMVGLTAPYMHNGALRTLEDVVDFYANGGGEDLSGSGTKDPALAPLDLDADERAALVAFLRDALTGSEIR